MLEIQELFDSYGSLMDPYHLLTIPYHVLRMPPAFASSSPSCSAFILILDSALDGAAGRGLEVPKLLKVSEEFPMFSGKTMCFPYLC